MFTVCPKCALTLVVTAADLRAAQGYVRCGRCSNVFNALVRLSEDRQAAAAVAASQTGQTPSDRGPSGTSTGSSEQSPSPPRPSPSTSGQSAATSGKSSVGPQPSQGAKQAAAPKQPAPDESAVSSPRKRTEPRRYDDNSALDEDSIPDTALEFDPAATDVTKVFVEQPLTPEWKAATGTFKSIKLEAAETPRAPEDQSHTDTQVDIEIDQELLVAMAQLSTQKRHVSELASNDDDLTSAPEPSEEPPAAPSAVSVSETPSPPAKSPTPAAAPSAQTSAPVSQLKKSSSARPPTQARAEPHARPSARAPTDAPAPDPVAPEPTDQSNPVSWMQPIAAVAREAAADAFGSRRAPDRFDRLWPAGSVLLVLVLAAQIVHHYRDDLAADARLNAPLTSLYAALGIPLSPRWNLGAYEVRQLGASTGAEGAGEITVRASVKNSAQQAQPMPLLRVTLQDRFGNRIAARDVPPQSYLPRAAPGSSLMSAGQRVDAEMAFVDPGTNAVGFEIDACLPSQGGAITCANDSAR